MTTDKVRNFLKGKINDQMSAEELQDYQSMLEELDNIDNESKATHEELAKCKDQIVTLVRTQGTATPPADDPEPKPRSLQEIANSVINGGK